ncbi:MAG: minor capsid protein [Erysipelotrichaceae bacterium]|nr:minor capsid protein [Erysipelotrichaceae bacterium]
MFRHIEIGSPTSKQNNELRVLTQMGKYATYRLLRTEAIYIVNMDDLEAAKRLGVTKRKFIATLDSRTSILCRKHNNQIVAIEDTKIGINTLPLHPFCRSVMIDYIPVLSDEKEWSVEVEINEKRPKIIEKEKEKAYNIGKDIDVEIDELTPCLRRLSDNKIVDTTVEEIKITKKFAKELKQQGWEFDWFKSQQEGYKIYQLKANEDDRIQGLLASKVDKKIYL